MIDLPQEYKQKMKALLNNDYDAFISTYEASAMKGLRINTLKVKNKDIFPFSLSPVPWCKEGFYYINDERPGKDVYHEMGLYYIQEPSAMSVVEALKIEKGDRVLDMCAAPGGKSTQAACKLDGSGIIVSNEIIPNRAKILSSNIERLGIKNSVVLNEECEKLKKRFKNFFNKIIVDAPCSGEGMFRKNPEAILEWSKDNVLMCSERQKNILEIAESLLQENGRIVYSTCTFEKEENEDVVDWFISKYKDFKIVEQKRFYPHKEKGEGHFYTVLERGNVDNADTGDIFPKKIKQNQDFVKFINETLTIPLEYNTAFGDNLYISPISNLDGLKVLRCGLHLGEVKKNRFEPSHSLALALPINAFKNVINLNREDKQVYMYLQGESIPTNLKGWGVVCVDGHPLGWFKGDGNIAKNHYPKGLRKNLDN